MAWRDKPKSQRFGDIGSIIGIIFAIIVAQAFFQTAEFWLRIIIYVIGLSLGRFIGTQIANRS